MQNGGFVVKWHFGTLYTVTIKTFNLEFINYSPVTDMTAKELATRWNKIK